MRRIKSVLVLAVLVLLLLWSVKMAFALMVSPGAFSAQNVEPGKDKDVGVDLIITNDTDEEREFSIKVVQPRPARNEALKRYSNLPNLEWFSLEKTNITVPARGQGKSRIFIKVPGEEKYFNQQWVVSCMVEYIGQKGMFQEAVATRYMIETKAKAEPGERPYGNTGIAPSVVKIKKEEVRLKEKPGFKIYNNTAAPHTYTIKSFVPKKELGKLAINVTPGLAWAKKTSWIKPTAKRIKVAAGGIGEVRLKVKVPQKALGGETGVEALIFVDSDTGERRFVRVQVE